MCKNFFFESKGPFKLNILFPNHPTSKIRIKDIKTLDKASKSDLSFFDSINYKDLAKNTKAACCITKENLPDLGDSNNDNIINVIDIIKIINYILGNTMMFSPYEIFASDLTLDNTIDVSDVLSIINLIID